MKPCRLTYNRMGWSEVMTFPWIWRLHFMGWPVGGQEEKMRKKQKHHNSVYVVNGSVIWIHLTQLSFSSTNGINNDVPDHQTQYFSLWPARETEASAQKPERHLMCASLLLALTVQAAIVVLPVCAHGVLFTHKHHFSHAHLRQPCSLQGPAHTEQLLRTNRRGVQTHTEWVIVALGTALNSKYIKRSLEIRDLLTTMSSSVTRGCRLFTVIFVPSKGLKAGWKEMWQKHMFKQW